MLFRVKPRVATALLTARTAYFLRWEQIAYRIFYRLVKPRVRLRGAEGVRPRLGVWAAPIAREPRLVGSRRFRFLNCEREVQCSRDWNNPEWDKLWLYNLHYFDDLVADDAIERRAQQYALIEQWIEENPPGWGNGWEPYPLSLRVANWVKWVLNGGELSLNAMDSLAVQGDWLAQRLEFHILGNHLLANAKALVFSGLFFEGDEAEGWLAKGWRLVDREIAEQILPDGGHFERSPMYHLIVLEDVLDLISVSRAFGREIPDSWLDAARRMLDWARVMRHPDGEIPFFNDAAIGVAPRPTELVNYAERLGIDRVSVLSEGAWAAMDSGYVRLAADGVTAFFDAAPVGPDYLPGHAHADTLSVEVSVDAQRILVNCGTSTYEVGGSERERQRGTRAHNTITLDDQDSSEMWGGFRVARRARVHGVEVEPRARRASAWHDGYVRLRGRPRHHRSISVSEQELRVEDRVTGGGEHTVELRWHLHPAVAVADLEDGATNEMRLIRLHAPNGAESRVLDMTIDGPGDLSIETTTYHPSFGVSLSTSCLVLRYRGALPVETVTKLSQ